MKIIIPAVDHAQLSGVVADQHHNEDHAARHAIGAADALVVQLTAVNAAGTATDSAGVETVVATGQVTLTSAGRVAVWGMVHLRADASAATVNTTARIRVWVKGVVYTVKSIRIPGGIAGTAAITPGGLGYESSTAPTVSAVVGTDSQTVLWFSTIATGVLAGVADVAVEVTRTAGDGNAHASAEFSALACSN